MHCICTGALSNADQFVDVEVGLVRTGADEPMGLVGQLDEAARRMSWIGIDGDRLQAVIASKPG